MLCPHCGQEHPENTKFCTITGKIIEEPMSRCPYCGRVLPQGLIFCTSCGKRLIENLTIENQLISSSTLSQETQINENPQPIEAEHSLFADPDPENLEQAPRKSIRCPSCSLEIPADSKFCIYCGALIDSHLAADASLSYDNSETESITCPQCFAELPRGTKFCIYCGFAIPQEQEKELVSETIETQNEPYHCPNCNTPYPYDESSGKPLIKYCTICGTLLLKEDLPTTNLPETEDNAFTDEQRKEGLIVCPHCGNELPAQTKFCIYCGNAVSATVDQEQIAIQAEENLSLLQYPILLSSEKEADVQSPSEPSAIKICNYCKLVYVDQDGICPSCGTSSQGNVSYPPKHTPATQNCTYCGLILPHSMPFCPSCNTQLHKEAETLKMGTPFATHKCNTCGLFFSDNEEECPSCGTPISKIPIPKDSTQPAAAADTQVCPACQADVPLGMAFCPNCGAALPPAPEPAAAADTQVCLACQADVPLGMAFCPNCGAALPSASQPQQQAADTQVCPACQADVPLGMAFCPNCGSALPSAPEPQQQTADTQVCPACQADVPLGMAFCPNCGAALPSASQPQQQAADTQVCPACQADVPLGMAFCPNCGSALPSAPQPAAAADTQVCPACQADVPLGMAFCPNCGAVLPSAPQPQQQADIETIHCPNCAEVIPADLFFCPICGTPLQKKESHDETNLKQSSAGSSSIPDEETEKKIDDTSSNDADLEIKEEVDSELNAPPLDSINEEDKVLCTNCGMRVLKTLKYCNYCGASIILFHENEDLIEESPLRQESISSETPANLVDNELKPLPPDTKTCPNCYAILPLGEKVCSFCGASLFQDQTSILCPQCGQELPLDAKFCVHCGASFYSELTPSDITTKSEEETLKTTSSDSPSEQAQSFLIEESTQSKQQNKEHHATTQPSAKVPSTQKIESCGYCGLRFTMPVKSCPSCGMPLQPSREREAEEDSFSLHKWSCTYCGLINKTEHECASCGTPQNGGTPLPAPLSPPPSICFYCSFVNEPKALTCASCGAPIKKEASPSSPTKENAINHVTASSSSQADYASIAPVSKSKIIEDAPSSIPTKAIPPSSVPPPTSIEENTLSEPAAMYDAADGAYEEDKEDISTSPKKPAATRKRWLLISGGIVLLFLFGIVGVAAWQGLNPKKTYSIEVELTQLATAYKPIATLAPKQLTPNPTITETQASALAASPLVPAASIGICSTDSTGSEQSCEPSSVPTLLETEAAAKKTAGPSSSFIPEAASSPTAQATSSTEQTKTNPRDQAILIKIPAGEFLMGSEVGTDSNYVGNEGPIHTVNLNEYWIYQTEVTNQMYAKCVEENACTLPKGVDKPTSHFKKSEFENHPVVQVNWDQAKMYCEWAGGRLPTEAEWEKAARGTDGRRFPWGNEPLDGTRLNYCDKQCSLKEKDEKQNDGYATTSPVGSYPKGASPYGVLDMAGNVWEWVADWFSPTYYRQSPRDNPQGPTDGELRVMRGGSWSNKLPVQFRAANRQSMLTNSTFDTLGFRCVIPKP